MKKLLIILAIAGLFVACKRNSTDLQTNKVKQIVGFVHLIHGVDSLKLLSEINKQSQKINKITDCLLQIHIAQEETKFGLDENELNEIISQLL